jgi:hypothetical protein
LLDKQRLMQAVWTNSVVEENNLNQQISTLRKVLGEGAGDHRFMVTVTGQVFGSCRTSSGSTRRLSLIRGATGELFGRCLSPRLAWC